MGAASREDYEKAIRSLRDGMEEVFQAMEDIRGISEGLGASWKDPQYHQFDRFIQEQARKVSTELDKVDEVASLIQTKLGRM